MESKKESILVFCESTNTIRQEPENYLIAHNENGRWVCDPDRAANYILAQRVFREIFVNHNSRYGTGLFLLSKVTPNKDFLKPKKCLLGRLLTNNC